MCTQQSTIYVANIKPRTRATYTQQRCARSQVSERSRASILSRTRKGFKFLRMIGARMHACITTVMSGRCSRADTHACSIYLIRVYIMLSIVLHLSYRCKTRHAWSAACCSELSVAVNPGPLNSFSDLFALASWRGTAKLKTRRDNICNETKQRVSSRRLLSKWQLGPRYSVNSSIFWLPCLRCWQMYAGSNAACHSNSVASDSAATSRLIYGVAYPISPCISATVHTYVHT